VLFRKKINKTTKIRAIIDFRIKNFEKNISHSQIFQTVKAKSQSSFDRLTVDLTLFKENPIILILLILANKSSLN
jgi:hypothetical protein